MTDSFVISIILNTNRREDTLECLRSLMHSSYSNHRAVVLDNHSTDGSVGAIRAAFPEVEIVKLEQNYGYAGNNNVGIQYALEQGADWVFVLNEDTILAEDCLSRLVETGESNAQIGIVGPMVYHHSAPNTIQTAGGRLGPRWEAWHLAEDEDDRGQYRDPHLVEWISGCGILVRRAVIEQVGMIDERYFYYWEETEWCLRAGRSGWQVVHVPQAKLWHKGVQRNHQPKPSVTYYATRNRLLTLSKLHAPTSARIFAWGELLKILTVWSVRPRWKTMQAHRNAMWRGMVDFLFHRWGQMQG